ncbi:PleD family two-component system response regulator [Candidatus Neomarinimicrobiota bacterium]
MHKILCIEDNDQFSQALKLYLEKTGHQVHVAIDGETGTKQAGEISPDIIILDVILPGIDGYQVCTELKKDAALKHIPVIMLTGENKMERVWMGMEVGADDYIFKSQPLDKVLISLDEKLAKYAL